MIPLSCNYKTMEIKKRRDYRLALERFSVLLSAKTLAPSKYRDCTSIRTKWLRSKSSQLPFIFHLNIRRCIVSILTALLNNQLHGDESFLKSYQSTATQEFPNILWNPKFHYRIQESRPLVHIRARLIQSIGSILILSSNLRLGLPSGFFRSDFPKNLYIRCLNNPNKK
jgi:hypothetical protein